MTDPTLARRLAAGLLLALALSGCMTVPTEHVLMFDSDGAPVDPSDEGLFGGYGRLWEPGDAGHSAQVERRYDAYVQRLLDALRLHVQTTGRRRVVVFVHGGLNTADESLERVADSHEQILQSGAFPIFVNWRSSLFTSYVDHLFWVRQGGHVFGERNDLLDDTFDVLGVLWSPFQFAADAARGVLRLPIIATYQLEETTEWLGWGRSPERESADAALTLTEAASDAPAPLAIPFVDGMLHDGDDALTWFEELFGFVRWVVFSPVKLVSTIAVDAGGTGSWDVMRGRVARLFHREDEFLGETAEREARGLLSAMARLAELQDELDLEIALVGHSMGGMVVNGLIQHANLYHHLEGDGRLLGGRLAPSESVRLPEFDEIVYLAAANSVREYEQAAFAYMLHDRRARAYHVVLHPENEIGEAPYYDLAPRGSLLTWIDDFLAKPTTPRDRTAGRYSNLLPALRDTPEELRNRVHVRVLPWNDDGLPQTHGEFDDVLDAWRFWDEQSWFPREQARNTR